MKNPGHRVIRFGTFEADSVAGELRKNGRRVSLQDQPFRVLMLLLEHPGEVVTRNELCERIWGEIYVDFEEGLNTAVRKLRDALGDSAANPRFIETLPRRGYRFIAPAEVLGGEGNGKQEKGGPRRSIWWLRVTGGVAIAIALGWLLRGWLLRERALSPSPPRQLTRDSGLTTDPVISRDGKIVAYASDRGGGNLKIWVQSISGGAARRLTNDGAYDYEPDISPDGSEVIFRSEREGAGIYTVPILGGEPRLIVKDGYLPRFSPDGARIAYSVGAFGISGFSGKLHIYTLSRGSTQVLESDLLVKGPAAWSPDGKSLVFAAAKTPLEPIYLWTCSDAGGAATRMSERPITEGPTYVGQIGTISVSWLGSRVIFSAKQGDSWNLFAGAVSPGNRKLNADPKSITVGTGNEVLPSVSATGSIVFANHSYATNLWEATLNQGAPVMRRLTDGRALNYRPSISADGSRMAYVSNRAGNFDVWVRDLVSGNEAELARTGKPEIAAAISRDGKQVAFWDGSRVYLAPSSGGAVRLLCENCGRPDDWLPDGKLIGLYSEPKTTPGGFGAWDPATGSFTKIAALGDSMTIAPHVSPDGNWITFHTGDKFNPIRQVFITRYTGQWAPPSRWIPITDGKALDREAAWSSDGNRVYFLSDRDGFRCIWGRKLNPKTKQPLESIYPVLHLHDSRLSLLHVPNVGNVGICSIGEKLIFAMGELTGNLWVTDLGQM